ncbi:hypothetical protein HK102_008271 [Quaeritorhiza haematococci]|nr:hypothetical protein HK102_008271 [Quaeritorhiza haematococci]
MFGSKFSSKKCVKYLRTQLFGSKPKSKFNSRRQRSFHSQHEDPDEIEEDGNDAASDEEALDVEEEDEDEEGEDNENDGDGDDAGELDSSSSQSDRDTIDGLMNNVSSGGSTTTGTGTRSTRMRRIRTAFVQRRQRRQKQQQDQQQQQEEPPKLRRQRSFPPVLFSPSTSSHQPQSINGESTNVNAKRTRTTHRLSNQSTASTASTATNATTIINGGAEDYAQHLHYHQQQQLASSSPQQQQQQSFSAFLPLRRRRRSSAVTRPIDPNYDDDDGFLSAGNVGLGEDDTPFSVMEPRARSMSIVSNGLGLASSAGGSTVGAENGHGAAVVGERGWFDGLFTSYVPVLNELVDTYVIAGGGAAGGQNSGGSGGRYMESLRRFLGLLVMPETDKKKLTLQEIKDTNRVRQRRFVLTCLTLYCLLVRYCSFDLFIFVLVGSNALVLYALKNSAKINVQMAKRSVKQRVGWAKQYLGGLMGRGGGGGNTSGGGGGTAAKDKDKYKEKDKDKDRGDSGAAPFTVPSSISSPPDLHGATAQGLLFSGLTTTGLDSSVSAHNNANISHTQDVAGAASTQMIPAGVSATTTAVNSGGGGGHAITTALAPGIIPSVSVAPTPNSPNLTASVPAFAPTAGTSSNSPIPGTPITRLVGVSRTPPATNTLALSTLSPSLAAAAGSGSGAGTSSSLSQTTKRLLGLRSSKPRASCEEGGGGALANMPISPGASSMSTPVGSPPVQSQYHTGSSNNGNGATGPIAMMSLGASMPTTNFPGVVTGGGPASEAGSDVSHGTGGPPSPAIPFDDGGGGNSSSSTSSKTPSGTKRRSFFGRGTKSQHTSPAGGSGAHASRSSNVETTAATLTHTPPHTTSGVMCGTTVPVGVNSQRISAPSSSISKPLPTTPPPAPTTASSSYASASPSASSSSASPSPSPKSSQSCSLAGSPRIPIKREEASLVKHAFPEAPTFDYQHSRHTRTRSGTEESEDQSELSTTLKDNAVKTKTHHSTTKDRPEHAQRHSPGQSHSQHVRKVNTNVATGREALVGLGLHAYSVKTGFDMGDDGDDGDDGDVW